MNLVDVWNAVHEAERTIETADREVLAIAKLLKERMRNLKSWTGTEVLKDLKRELSQFNAVKGTWKS